MGKVQIVTSPLGEEMVILPRAEYEALISALDGVDEDEADVALYDARKAELEREPQNVFPPELSMLVLRGNSRLKAIRLWRSMKQSDLAKASGIGQGSLSDLESGRRPGSKETLARLAKGLGVDVNWLA
jgi:DNA-binding XRE family transcriptional regulator